MSYRGGVRSPLPDQQRGGDDHPLAWVAHSPLLGPAYLCMMVYIIAGQTKPLGDFGEKTQNRPIS